MKKIRVLVNEQRLELYDNDDVLFSSSVSTAKKGVGEINGSEMTPRGWHVIRAKIGAHAVMNTVFVARRPTGEIYNSALRADHPRRDWILTRILWLSGIEPGFNRLGQVDTMQRYIYIHGCPDEDQLGMPGSHGCIKMRNSEIVRLFDLVDVGTKVYIVE